jgi:hypothetical protein
VVSPKHPSALIRLRIVEVDLADFIEVPTRRWGKGFRLLAGVASCVCLTVWLTAAYAIGAPAGGRTPVAPWDVDDIPALTAGVESNLIPDPKESIPVNGYKAEFKGLALDLRAVSRTIMGTTRLGYNVNSRSWSPDGGAYRGWDVSSHWGMSGSDREGKGARYLAFRVTSDKPQDVSLYGFVPGSAHLGSDLPQNRGVAGGTELQMDSKTDPRYGGYTAEAWQKYRPAVVVENDRADRFFLGVSVEPWQELGMFSQFPRVVSKPFRVSATWGTLTIERLVPKAEGKFASEPYIAPPIKISIDPATEPRQSAFRIRLLDAAGAQVGVNGVNISGDYPSPDQLICHVTVWDRVDRIVVEGRPLTYLEFKNVHYYPDAGKWPETRWGQDGYRDVQKVEGVGQLEGIVAPTATTMFDELDDFYTPSGARWAEYPDQGLLGAGSNNLPGFEHPMAALIRFDPRLAGCTPEFSVFGSAGPDPGKGSASALVGAYSGPSGGDKPYYSIRFKNPDGLSYLHIKVRMTERDWRILGSVKPPTGRFGQGKPGDFGRLGYGVQVDAPAFAVAVLQTGELAFKWIDTGGRREDRPKQAQWDGTAFETRLKARLKSGERIDLRANAWAEGSKGFSYVFALDKNQEPVFYEKMMSYDEKHPEGVESILKTVYLKDVEEFEVEGRRYGQPFYFVAKLPKLQ